MSPGAPEEAAKAAGTFFEALKDQPLSLALVVMNLCLLAYLYYQGIALNNERKSELDLLYKNRREVAVLLARCTWPQGLALPKELEDERSLGD